MMVDPEAPDYPPRAYRGYHCTTQSSCLDEQRCYRRFPNSDGYCVPMEYYETHDRGCKTDRDCTPTEICAEIAGAEFGRCEHRFEEKTQSK